MKVAYVSNFRGVGGGTVNAKRLCRHFSAETSIDLTAIHAQGTGLPEMVETAEQGFPCLYPPTLEDGLEAVDPDVVFVHAFNPDLIDWMQTQSESDDRVYVWRNGVNTAEQWLNLNTYEEPRRVTAPIADLGFFDAIFAPSHAAAERVQLNYGDDAPHLAVAPVVIEFDQYAPTPYMDEGTLRVVTASRIAANNYLLSPLLAVRRLVDEIDVEMEILSAGDDLFMTTVTNVADPIEGVRVVGHVDEAEVRDHLQWADVVCVPSVTHQAVPTIAAEAMAAGNVVLTGTYHTTNEEPATIPVSLDHPPAWYHAIEDAADGATEVVREGLDRASEYDVGHVVREAYLPMLNLLGEQYGRS